ELLREIQYVPNGSRPKRVDGLRVVTDDSQSLAVWLHAEQDGRLKAIRVLIFIYEDVVKAFANFPTQGWLSDGLRPVQQQIVVVEYVLRLLRSEEHTSELS